MEGRAGSQGHWVVVHVAQWSALAAQATSSFSHSTFQPACSVNVLLLIILHACARGKVIGSVIIVFVVDTRIVKILRSRDPLLSTNGIHLACLGKGRQQHVSKLHFADARCTGYVPYRALVYHAVN